MLFKYFYDELLAQASYMVGCQSEGIAIVIDPMRDITPYIAFAIQKGLTITHIAETHIHADFVSGSRQLATATGAKIILSAEGGDDWQYQFPSGDDVMLVKNGDRFSIGSALFEVLHTPGHTPEHISYLLTDTQTTQLPLGIFTGDCLFVGDMGRPDLLDKTALATDTSADGARQQYANVHRFRSLPDYLQVFPGHGAGSACGKNLGAIPTSTLGYEKLSNPGFKHRTEDDFVAWLLNDQPEAPTYFAHMKQVNRHGATLLHELAQAQHVREVPGTDIIPPDALFIDTRPIAEFQHKHIAGSINIPISSSGFNTYVGWYINYHKPTFFIAYQLDVQEVLQALFAIGVDDVPAYFTPDVIEDSTDTQAMMPIRPLDAYEMEAYLVDVREKSEYNQSHIVGAHHIPMGAILPNLDHLPHHEKVVIYCETGVRSQVVVSLLRSMGYPNVINLDGGIQAWEESGLPLATAG